MRGNALDQMLPAASEGHCHRVLIMGTTPLVGGMENQILNLAGHLPKSRYEVHLVFPESENRSKTRDLCQQLGVGVPTFLPNLDMLRKTGSFPFAAFAQEVRRFRPHLVHIHFPESFIGLSYVLAARRTRTRCVVSLHGVTRWEGAGKRKQYFSALAAHLCDRISVNSLAVKRSAMAPGIAERAIMVIPCGTPLPVRTTSRSQARAALGIPEDRFVVAAAGRLVRQKRMAEVIGAVGAIHERRDVTMVIAGDGPEREPLEEAARTAGIDARFLGFVKNMDDVYAVADVFALPSEGEAFGLVYVEAAMCGVPSIGANQGGVPEVIEDGVTGLLVPLDDAPALRNALQKLYDAPERTRAMGEAAFQRASSEFTVERMAQRFDEFYRPILIKSKHV